MITCTRIFEWDAAHRVWGHENKCKHLHGHRYKAEVTFSQVSNGLDDIGRVIDFGALKQVVGTWIDQNWDHNILLHKQDPLALCWWHPDVIIVHTHKLRMQDIFQNKCPYIFAQGNPTAENIALLLHSIASQLTKHLGVWLPSVKVWETPNCYAEFLSQGVIP